MQESAPPHRARCTGYTSAVVSAFLAFIYKGGSEVSLRDVYPLTCLADQYRVTSLTLACTAFLEGQSLQASMQVGVGVACWLWPFRV